MIIFINIFKINRFQIYLEFKIQFLFFDLNDAVIEKRIKMQKKGVK